MKKIKKTLTALGNPKISNELKNNNINIVANDIQYQEGIIEYLESNNNIDYLIIDERIPGNLKVNELVYTIKSINKKIKIILITNNNNQICVYKKIKEANIKEIVKIINNENIFMKKQIPINNFFSEKTKEAEIITVLGANGIGKTVFSIAYAENQREKKILIMDFDILNISIHSLFIKKSNTEKENRQNYNKKSHNKETHNKETHNKESYNREIHDSEIQNSEKYYEENLYYKDSIIHSKNNIDFFSGINLILKSKNQSSPQKVKKIIKKLKKEYDIIIIDTSTESLLEYTKEIIKATDSAIFISGANLLEVKKSKRLLEIYEKEWGISNKKINIIFNKCTSQSIDEEVLRMTFKKYNILGKIELNEYYDVAVNKRLKSISKINKELEKIFKNYNKKLKIKKIRRTHGIS